MKIVPSDRNKKSIGINKKLALIGFLLILVSIFFLEQIGYFRTNFLSVLFSLFALLGLSLVLFSLSSYFKTQDFKEGLAEKYIIRNQREEKKERDE